MSDVNKTKKQLIAELKMLRHRIVEKEKVESDIKKIKEAHRLSQEQSCILTENARDGVYIINVDHGFEYVNPAFEKIFGYKAEEVVRNDFRHDNLIHPDDKEIVRKRKKAREKSKEIPSLYEFRIITKKGEVRRVEVNTVLLPGKEKNILGILRDITGRKQKEEELKKKQEELITSEKKLKEFSQAILSVREEERKTLSTVLHNEVGGMAVVIFSALNIVEEGIKNESLYDSLDAIEKAKSMLMEFVSKIKEVAKNLRPVGLEETGLPSALKNHFSEIEQCAKIHIDYTENLGRVKIGDKTEIVLFRIAQESINNIIKHAEATEVKVHLCSRKNWITLNIRDNGNGFDTEKYFNENNSKLGLRAMQEMVESLDGTLRIDSVDKKGTTLHVTVPVEKHEN